MHPLVWRRYKALGPRFVSQYATEEKHPLSAREQSAQYINERRRRRLYAEVASRILAEAQPSALSLEEQFGEQAKKWRQETEHLSSPTQMMMHPSYQAILGMAQGHEQEMVDLMLRDLRNNRTPWFWALSYLTKDNPVRRSDVGKLDKMIKAWLDWGKARGRL